MERVLTAAQMRACDAHAIEAIGIPGVVLMENAGREAARRILELLGERGRARAIVYCGAGNNGGDGFVVARLLRDRGVDVSLVLSRPVADLAGDAAVNARVAEKLGIPMRLGSAPWRGEALASVASDGPLVIDALLGTGLAREVSGVIGELVDEVNVLGGAGCPVVALDVPSGIDSDTGEVMGRAVRADLTVTFGYSKRGLIQHPGASHAGRLVVVDIGLPRAVEEILEGPRVDRLTERGARALLPSLPADAHKGTFGHVLAIAGSPERPGAAALVCKGALRGGAGLVTLATRSGGDASLRALLPEAMGVLLPGDGPLSPADLPIILDAARGKDVIAVGPGVPRGPRTKELLMALAQKARLPMIIDADGLNALADDPDVLVEMGRMVPLVLTPHPKEMSRLTGLEVRGVQADRIGLAAGFAEEKGVHLILKGAGTVIADPDGSVAVCTAGGPALATGGTGDVLTGLIAALVAGGLEPPAACRVGVMAHALAGEGAGERLGRAGALASDVADELGAVWRAWRW